MPALGARSRSREQPLTPGSSRGSPSHGRGSTPIRQSRVSNKPTVGLDACVTAHLVTKLDRATAPAGEEDAVTSLDVGGHNLASAVRRAGAGRDDGRLGEGLARRRRRKVNTARGFLFVPRPAHTRTNVVSTQTMTKKVPAKRTVSGLKRRTRTRSRRGTTALMDLNVA